MVLFLPLDEYQGFHNRSQVRMDEIKMSMLNSRNKFHFDEILHSQIKIQYPYHNFFTDTTHSHTLLSNNT